jgi:hypothetical protein
MAPGDTASNQRSRNTRIDSSELFLPLRGLNVSGQSDSSGGFRPSVHEVSDASA